MGAGPSDDRSTGRRGSAGGLPPVPGSGARAGDAGTGPRASSPGRPSAVGAPLAARTDLLDRPDPRPPGGNPPDRVRRFVRRHGWRAWAIPFLVAATVFALVDLALGEGGSTPGTGASPTVATTEPERPPPTTSPEPAAPAEGDVGPVEPETPAVAATYVEQGAGSLSVVDGTSPVLGTGPLSRFIVEVEDGIEVDGAAYAEAVSQTLGDPRSWGAGGRRSFQRVGAAEAATGQFDFRVALVSPGSMETYCPGVGTGGYTSCRYGDRAVINLARWVTAVPHYDGDIATYRQYVVNHEVGHALGERHVDCPGPGRPAPVMQQQTLGLQGCVRNAWPYP